MREENFELIKSNGQKIRGKMMIPDGEGKFPTVIFAHGFGGNYTGMLPDGEKLAANGLACIFFDFCGGGLVSSSDGKMTEMTPLTEAEDLTTVLHEAAKFSFVDENNLFLLGGSMGGFVSAYVAGQYPEKVKGLILWFPAFVIPDDARKRLVLHENKVFNTELSPDHDPTAVSIDIWNEIVKYRGPVTIIHGDCDIIVPLIYSEKANYLYHDSKLTVIPNAGHGFEGEDSETARNISLEFIKNCLDK